MIDLLVAVGVLMLFGGIAVMILGLVSYFFPPTTALIPDEWQTALSLKFGVYYFVAGLALTFLLK